MNKKVLLINPPMTYLERIEPIRLPQPLGLMYIAAYLEKDGYEVKLLDTHAEGYHNRKAVGERTQVGMEENEIKEAVLKENPAVIGVAQMFTDQSPNGHMVCRAAKSACPDVPTVMGGVYPTDMPDVALADENVDYLLTAEAEESFKHFCDWKILKDDKAYEKIDGLNGARKHKWIQDLDTIPFPARHLIPIEKYFDAGRAYREHAHKRIAFPMITSRCCPIACTFCATHSMMGSYRQRSPQNVIEEIEYLIENYGMEEIYFLDDALVHDNFRELLRIMAKKDYGLTWHGANGTAIYDLDDELIELHAATGCYKMIFSIESGVPTTLKYMKKTIDLNTAPNIVKKVQNLGMRAESMFMLGLSVESKADIRKTVAFAESLNLDYVSFPLATPFKGTVMYKDLIKRGVIRDDIPVEDLKFGIANIDGIDWDAEWVENFRVESWKRLNPELAKATTEFMPAGAI